MNRWFGEWEDMNLPALHQFIEEKYRQYNRPEFIETDPVSIPHLFSRNEDIEISGFLTATISWGQRKSIIANARKLMLMMDNAPFDFLTHAREKEYQPFLKFVHRTFNGEDCLFFLNAMRNIYSRDETLEHQFANLNIIGAANAISQFREVLLQDPHLKRSEKHLANPTKGSSAKRINMFLRWMVRDDKRGVDFGIWKSISPANLICPLDVHSGRTARKLGLLKRQTNDWKAAEELTANLRQFDPSDPVKYDFALFGLGVSEKF